jgi:alpha-D-xyloside xylohydrolase
MQYGAFTPMMRSHGTDVYREIYYYGNPGEPVYDALVDAIKLRYRLMPYTYSLSWQVSKNDDSFMRPLMMDFKHDKNTWNMSDEYMYGHNFLVCPVGHPLYTEERIIKTNELTGWNKNEATGELYRPVNWKENKTYEVYLPDGTKWYDYWTNKVYDGGQNIDANAPLAIMPLFVKAGSIIPVGPEVQYTDEKPWDNLDIVVYPGADAEFTLYEDEGDNYNYEKGLYSTIKFKWNDKARTLTIDRRQGEYPGMLTTRKFNVKVVGGAEKTIDYNGRKVSIKG